MVDRFFVMKPNQILRQSVDPDIERFISHRAKHVHITLKRPFIFYHEKLCY